MLRRLVTTLASTAAVTAALAAGAAVPAHAEEVPRLRLVAGGATVGAYAGGLTVSATCSANALGTAASVSITTCRLVRADGLWTPNHPAAGPANVAVSTFTETIDTLGFALCYEVSILDLDVQFEPETFSGCVRPEALAELTVYG